MIRKATTDDCEDLGRVHVLSWQQAYADLLPASYLDSLNPIERAKNWSEALDAGANVLLDVDGSTLAGFAAFGECRDDDARLDWGELAAIYYLESYWGNGRAQHLFQVAKTSLEASGFARITLWVLEGNDRAIKFYRKNGFEFDGKTQTEDRGDFQMTELRMAIVCSPA